MSFSFPKYNIETEEHVETTTAAPAVKLDVKLKNEILRQVREEGTVIVHCSYTSLMEGGNRIWTTTVLIDLQSGSRSRMLHAENITFAPVWMDLPVGDTAKFTLIFAPLPKTCERFDLYEDIPQSGRFHVKNIKRNKSDVYHVVIW